MRFSCKNLFSSLFSTFNYCIFRNIPVSRTPIRSVIHDIFLISESNNQALCSLSIQDSPRHFCIRDDDIICNVIVPCDEKNEIICSPGSILQAVINFEASVQPCHSVKTTLVQVELRHDGSVVQVRKYDYKLILLSLIVSFLLRNQ